MFGLVSDAWCPKGVSFDRHKSKRSNSVVHSEFFLLQEKVIKKKRTRDYMFGLVSDAWRPKGVSFDRHKSKRSNSVVHSEFFCYKKK